MTDNDFTLDVGGDVEAGTYLCTLVGWEPSSYVSNGTYSPAGEDVLTVKWTFATEDDQVIDGMTSRSTHPKSKLFAWCAGLGLDVRTVKGIKADMMVGRSALVTISLNPEGFAVIDAVVPAPKSKSKE